MLLPTAWSCGMPLIGRQWEHMGHHFIEYHLQFGCVRFWGVYNGNMWRCSKYDKGERGWWNLERGDFCMRVSHSSIQQKAWTLVGLLPIHLKRRGVKRLWGTSNIIWCQINYNRGAYSQSQPHELSTWYWEFDHVWTKFWRGQYQYCHDTCPWSWVRTNEQSTHTLEIAWYVWTKLLASKSHSNFNSRCQNKYNPLFIHVFLHGTNLHRLKPLQILGKLS